MIVQLNVSATAVYQQLECDQGMLLQNAWELMCLTKIWWHWNEVSCYQDCH